MGSSELSIDVVRWAIGVEQLRADIASQNIASKNLSGAQFSIVNFQDALNAVKLVLNSPLDEAIASEQIHQIKPDVTPSSQSGSLDEQVADLATAELRYRVLAEGLSRQLSLLTLAVSGKS